MQTEDKSGMVAGMRMRVLLSAMVCALLLIGCSKEGEGRIPVLAAEQFAEIRDRDLPELAARDIIEPELIEIFHQTVEDFSRTMEVKPKEARSGVRLLHLACFFKKPELARWLLLNGVDPNAHDREDDSPLLLAVDTYAFPDTPTDVLVNLVDILLAKGADFEQSGHEKRDFLTEAAFVCENEDVILHLMEKGARPDSESAQPPALHGWPRMLGKLLENPTVGKEGLLHAAAVGCCRFPGDHSACIKLLLNHGAKVSDSKDSVPGNTALFNLAQELSATEQDSPLLPQALDVAVFLLHNGADPYARARQDEDFPGFCPYDFLSMKPYLLDKLRERGITLQSPPLQFSSGKTLLADICRAAISPHPGEQLSPHFDSIAAVFSLPDEMRGDEMYPQAVDAGIALLTRVDPARCSRTLLAIPLWQQPSFTERDSRELLRPILDALRDTPSLSFPADFLEEQALKAAKAGLYEDAADLVELLARSPNATEKIERLCNADSLPLRAGAYAAQLATAGLPEARDNGVASWLAEHNREPDSPFLQDAVLLTSLEKLWFGKMPREEQARLFALMRNIHAPHAAEAYETLAKNWDHPEELDRLMNADDEWKYELEVATARFFFEHSNEFLPSAP